MLDRARSKRAGAVVPKSLMWHFYQLSLYLSASLLSLLCTILV
jgi:hypothetical protein